MVCKKGFIMPRVAEYILYVHRHESNNSARNQYKKERNGSRNYLNIEL
jgi:hypothetical protein